MSVEVLRFWGIVTGAALVAFALWVAALGPEAPAVASTPPLAVAQEASAQGAPLAFIVRFRGSGPIARAQADAQRGRVLAAQRRIELQLRRQRAFVGLCFDRFTAGASEVVLRTCQAISPDDRASEEAGWLSRLRAMRAVAYVDLNADAGPARAG